MILPLLVGWLLLAGLGCSFTIILQSFLMYPLFAQMNHLGGFVHLPEYSPQYLHFHCHFLLFELFGVSNDWWVVYLGTFWVGTPLFGIKLPFFATFSNTKISPWLVVALITLFKLFLGILAILYQLKLQSPTKLTAPCLFIVQWPRRKSLLWPRSKSFLWVRLLNSRAFCWIISSKKYCLLKEATNSDQVMDVISLKL